MLTGALSLFRGGVLGKLLGLLREALMAYLFGASEVVAAARVAQTAVLGPMNLLTSDALSGAFLPQQARLLRDNPSAARALYRSVQILFTTAAVLFVPAMLAGGEYWTVLIAPGLSPDATSLAYSMGFAMAVGAPWYVHYNLFAYLEMAHGRYKLSSIRSTGQSLGLIGGVLAAYLLGQPTLIAWGFTAAYIFMCIGGFFYMKSMGFFAPPGKTSWVSLWAVLSPFGKRLRLLILLPFMALAVDITEKMVASNLGATTLASIDYARLVTDTFVLLLAMPIGLASLSSFSIMTEDKSLANTRRVLKPLLLLALGLSGLVASFSPAIVEILYSRGAFDSNAVSITASVLAGLGLGLWAQLSNYFALKVLNARSRNRTVVVAVLLGAVVTILSRPVLVGNLGPFGIGLAVSLGFVASLSVCLFALSALTVTLQSVAWSLPPLVLAAFAGTVTHDWEAMPSLATAFGVLIVWLLYLLAVPSTRGIVTDVIQAVRRRR